MPLTKVHPAPFRGIIIHCPVAKRDETITSADIISIAGFCADDELQRPAEHWIEVDCPCGQTHSIDF